MLNPSSSVTLDFNSQEALPTKVVVKGKVGKKYYPMPDIPLSKKNKDKSGFNSIVDRSSREKDPAKRFIHKRNTMHDNLKTASQGFDMKNKTLSSDFTVDMARYL